MASSELIEWCDVREELRRREDADADDSSKTASRGDGDGDGKSSLRRPSSPSTSSASCSSSNDCRGYPYPLAPPSSTSNASIRGACARALARPRAGSAAFVPCSRTARAMLSCLYHKPPSLLPPLFSFLLAQKRLKDQCLDIQALLSPLRSYPR